jgi:hypothetical protein
MLRCHDPVKESLLSVVDVDITPVAMDVYGQVKSASVRLKLPRRLIPTSGLSMERNGGPYGVVFHADTIQDRDDYKDLDEWYLLAVEEIAGQSWTVTDVAATCIQSIHNVAPPRAQRSYTRAWKFTVIQRNFQGILMLQCCLCFRSSGSICSWDYSTKKGGHKASTYRQIEKYHDPTRRSTAPEGFVLLPIVNPFINKRINYQYDDQLPI